MKSVQNGSASDLENIASEAKFSEQSKVNEIDERQDFIAIDNNEKMISELFRAIKSGNSSKVEALILAGADVNAIYSNPTSPFTKLTQPILFHALDFAESEEGKKIFKILVDNPDANIRCVNNREDDIPLFLRAIHKTNFFVMKELLKKGIKGDEKFQGIKFSEFFKTDDECLKHNEFKKFFDHIINLHNPKEPLFTAEEKESSKRVDLKPEDKEEDKKSEINPSSVIKSVSISNLDSKNKAQNFCK